MACKDTGLEVLEKRQCGVGYLRVDGDTNVVEGEPSSSVV